MENYKFSSDFVFILPSSGTKVESKTKFCFITPISLCSLIYSNIYKFVLLKQGSCFEFV